MLCKSKISFQLIISLAIGLCLSGGFLLGLPFSQATTPKSLTSSYPIKLMPDRLMLNGHVATKANTAGQCTESWLSDVPAGTIILGLDPDSCDPANWDGGSATAEIFLPDIYAPTVVVLKLSWPDRAGKGLRSPEPDRMGTITLDGRPLWGKSTTRLNTLNDYYYAADHKPILTTLVLTQSMTHTLSISVSAHTAWDLSQIELNAYPYPTAIKGIGYSPFRDCQFPNPAGIAQPSTDQMEEDLFRLFHTSNAIRTYAATGVNGQIPALANDLGLPVYAGAWIDYPKTTIAQDNSEIQALIDLAHTSALSGAIVGNEYYLRHRTVTATNYLLDHIRRIKAALPENVPVATAEIDDQMFVWDNLEDFEPEINPIYRPILDEIDFIMVHIYPFWSGMPIDGAADFTIKRYKAIQELIAQEYPGKWVIIGEAGWPSAGEPQGDYELESETLWPSTGQPQSGAVPSLENQRRYMLEFLYLAEQEQVNFMYFDAFDELWKIEEPGRVGQNWGYSYSDRQAKHNFYGVLLPGEQLFPYRVDLPLIIKYTTSDLHQQPIARPAIDAPLPIPVQASSHVTFSVYTEWPAGPDGFVPSGWMGDTENIELFECDRSMPHGGDMATRVSFSPGTLGWGGIYWQHPENNWGDNPKGGVELTGAQRLTFWAWSDTPNAVVTFLIGGIGYPNGTNCSPPDLWEEQYPYPDSVCPVIKQTEILTPTWTKYTINLPQSRDLSQVVGGFGWVANDPVTFYLDDILYEFD
jgi:exo-beta-1,3-glucanase (GH17 family)